MTTIKSEMETVIEKFVATASNLAKQLAIDTLNATFAPRKVLSWDKTPWLEPEEKEIRKTEEEIRKTEAALRRVQRMQKKAAKQMEKAAKKVAKQTKKAVKAHVKKATKRAKKNAKRIEKTAVAEPIEKAAA